MQVTFFGLVLLMVAAMVHVACGTSVATDAPRVHLQRPVFPVNDVLHAMPPTNSNDPFRYQHSVKSIATADDGESSANHKYNTKQHTDEQAASSASMVQFDYNVRVREDLIRLDHLMQVYAVKCRYHHRATVITDACHMLMQWIFVLFSLCHSWPSISVYLSNDDEWRWSEGSIIAGGKEWGCVAAPDLSSNTAASLVPTSFIRSVVAMVHPFIS
jgi:hypothetical protein